MSVDGAGGTKVRHQRTPSTRTTIMSNYPRSSGFYLFAPGVLIVWFTKLGSTSVKRLVENSLKRTCLT